VKTLGLALDMVFVWEDKPKGCEPGKTTRMKVHAVMRWAAHAMVGGTAPRQSVHILIF
jgi:hypothetical protein